MLLWDAAIGYEEAGQVVKQGNLVRLHVFLINRLPCFHLCSTLTLWANELLN